MKKVFHIGATFKAMQDGNDLIIAGMASTNDQDRVGDVVRPEAWTKSGGLNNYLNNPIILFNHNYDKPIGRAMMVGTTDKGLELKAKIAKSAGEVGELIKEGVLGAFSVGFRVKDADYNSETDGYEIKDAELLEVSVVSVPANQAATFSVAKSFDSEKEYEAFKQSFKHDSIESTPSDQVVEAQEKTMDPNKDNDGINVDKIVADALEKYQAQQAMKDAEQKAEQKRLAEEAEKKAAEEAERKAAEQRRVVTAVESGTEKLLNDFQEKLSQKDADHQRVIKEFEARLAEKADEIEKITGSKRVFADRTKGQTMTSDEAVNAHLLGVITRKGLDTKLGRNIMDKAVNTDTGVAVPSQSVEAYETFVSTQIERDIQLDLVLDPLFRKIQMNAASMVIPIMPDAGYAEYVTGDGSGTGSAYHGNLEERGDTVGSPFAGMDMTSKVLQTSKLTSVSYIANEVEEDAIIPVLPLIREGIIRSHSRAVEQSILMGGHADAALTGAPDGLVERARDASKVLDVGSPGTTTPITAAHLLNMRQAMGKYGRRPADVIYIVSLDAYYDLIDDAEFQNLNEVGQRASKITGEIGQVFGSSVIICDEFPTKAAGKAWGVAVNTRNFIVPVQRGVTVEQDYEVVAQRRVLVATQRRGFDNIFNNGGGGQVVAYTW